MYDTSLISLYVDHVAMHVWDKNVYFICFYYLYQMCYNIHFFYNGVFHLQDRVALKCINHSRNIAILEQLEKD